MGRTRILRPQSAQSSVQKRRSRPTALHISAFLLANTYSLHLHDYTYSPVPSPW